jgi:capsular polysaccharide transport system ATP-binding protein
MITLEHVSKRSTGEKGPGKWILQDVSLHIPVPPSVAVFGEKDQTAVFLRVLTGMEPPSSGNVRIDARVSFPTRYNRNMQPILTGRQNATFLCRINGYGADLETRIAEVERISMLGTTFDQPVRTYTQKMKGRLGFALSWAFDFDVYIADSMNFAGANAFGNAELAEAELARRSVSAGFILTVPKGHGGDAYVKQLCRAAIRLQDGKALWYDRMEDALAAAPADQRREHAVTSAGPQRGEGHAERRRKAAEAGAEAADASHPALARIINLQRALVVLRQGLLGGAPVIEERQLARLLRVGRDAGLELASREELAQAGAAPQAGALPIFKVAGAEAPQVEYFERKPGAARNNDEQIS